MNQKKERKPNGYWTFERCKEEALKYNTRTEFVKNSKTAYSTAWRYKWLDAICCDMKEIKKPNGYWTFERCKEEALKYNNKTDFKNVSKSAYSIAEKNKWLDEICRDMLKNRLKKGYWQNINNLKEEALKYNNKTDFRKNNSAAFTIAHKKGLIDNICSHMKPKNNFLKRMVYVYEFKNGYFYVGLTYNESTRKFQHLNDLKSPVYKHSKKYKIIPTYIKKTDLISQQEAQILEYEILRKYINDGWKPLNKNKTGGLGGNSVKWDYNKFILKLKESENKTKFIKEHNGLYQIALKKGWWSQDIIDLHLNCKRKIRNYWTKEKFIEFAKNCKTFKEFIKIPGLYDSIKKYDNLLNKICKEFYNFEYKKKYVRPKNYWNNYNNCEKHAKECINRKDFGKKYFQGWFISKRNGWLDEFFPQKNN